MLIPPAIQINSIQDVCVCHFKDKSHRSEGPPHFYVIIPVNAASDIILTMITSQVANKEAYYQANPRAAGCLVRVNNGYFAFLNRDSVIDCNNAELLPKADLLKKFDPAHGFTMKAPTIPEHVKRQIIRAINCSPLVKPYIKKLLPVVP